MRLGKAEVLALGQLRRRPAVTAEGQLPGIPAYPHFRPGAATRSLLLDHLIRSRQH